MGRKSRARLWNDTGFIFAAWKNLNDSPANQKLDPQGLDTFSVLPCNDDWLADLMGEPC